MELTIEQTLQQGVAAHKKGNVREAERLYQAILQFHPAHPDANHNLGVLAVSANKARAALPLFKTALEANPKIEQFWLSYIGALIKEQQFENAKQVLEQGVTQGVVGEKFDALESQMASKTQNFSPTNPSQQQLNSLLECYQNGWYEDAEKLALSITKRFPEHLFAWKVLGALFSQTGKNLEALNAKERVVQLAPHDAEAHSNLGITLKELGRLEESEASVKQAIALNPDFAEAHSNLGVILQQLERLDEAEASCRRAIVLKLDYAEAHNNLGNTLKKLGILEEAEASLRQSIALKPDFAEAYNNLGNTLKKLGRLDEAEASYTQAITLKSGFTAALMNRWQILFDKSKFDAALRDADSCNTEKSRVCALETLYALGRIDEIYKRIEMLSELDDGNLRLAAFSSFISEREKNNTAHKFCQNPMSFIHFANVSSHLEGSNQFVKEVIDELHNVKTIWEPYHQATLKGFQTPPCINLFVSQSEKMVQLKSIIFDELDAYYLKFRNKSCSYIKKWPSKKTIYGWHVILKQQGYQSPHIHPDGWLSGVIYLKVVPSLGNNEGAIKFSLNGANYSDLNSPELTYQPELGDIVFFPSSLNHRTIPFTTDTDRIIISFDLMPELAKH